MTPTTADPGEVAAAFAPAGEPNIILHGMLRNAGPDAPAVVVCHPLPLLGGTSENLVVRALCRGLADAGWTTLRFDFRGAGRSSGGYARGLGEVADVLGALDLLEERAGASSRPVALVGYSFGALVGLRSVFQTRGSLAGFVGVAFPTDVGAAPVAGVREAVPVDDLPALGVAPCPALLVSGDADAIARLSEVERIWPGARTAVKTKIRGADHLFRGSANKAMLCARVRDFLAAGRQGEA